MAQLNFDASQVKPSTANDPIPPGWYVAYMSASETKPTSDGSGMYLNCEYTIQSPPEFAGRKVFDRMNIQNKNPLAQEIAWQTLSAVCHATGVIQVQDSQQLHNIPLMVKVKLRPAGPGADGKQYEASNEVTGYKAVNAGGAAPAAAPAAPTPPAPPAAPAGWTPPVAPSAGGWTPPAAAPAPATPPATPPAAPTGAPHPAWAAAPAPAAVTPPAVATPPTAAPVATPPSPPWATPPAA